MSTRTRAQALRWCATALYHTGVLRVLTPAINYASRRPRFQILTYHRVNDDHDPFFPATPTSIFDHVYGAPHSVVEEERAWFEQYESSFLPAGGAR